MNGTKKLVWGFALAFFLAAGWHMARAESQTETIKGFVLDSACAFTKDLKKPISVECAVACAEGRVAAGDSDGQRDDLLADLRRHPRPRPERPADGVRG